MKRKKILLGKEGNLSRANAAIPIKSSVRVICHVANVGLWDAPPNAHTAHGIVRSNFLEQLLEENRRFKEQWISSAGVAETNGPPQVEGSSSLLATATEVSDSASHQNPLIGDRAWFHRYDSSSPPIYIGEAACSAFATRFRRFLTGNNTAAHITRTQWEREEVIAEAASDGSAQWPSLHHARLLIRIAINQIGHLYHLMMRKTTLDQLEHIYQAQKFDSAEEKCKFFALFAFGQAYSVRSDPTAGLRVPGTAYFAQAMKLVQILPERTSLTHLETLLLLSLYSYYLNRRHSAYVLIGNAMRMGLTIGLNHNIAESQIIDPVERQHRIELWWTIYIFDRMWGSKMGLPMQILDEDIHVDLPSMINPNWRHQEELSDPDYMKANIKLARIAGETITRLYSRRKYDETFLQRVQKLLKSLKNWVDTLPESLRLNMEDLESSKKPVVSLHMAFNQCIILTTRPTLLHLLITLRKNNGSRPLRENFRELVSQPVLTLSEACIHAARHSHSMILTRWINGTCPSFGYFHAHYLFSCALILAMSSFVPIGTPKDMSGFDSALDVLRSMSENGNLAAAEFYNNLTQVKLCLDDYKRATQIQRTNLGSDAPPGTADPQRIITSTQASRQQQQQQQQQPATQPPSTSLPRPFFNASTDSTFPTDGDSLLGQSSQGLDAHFWSGRDSLAGYTTEMAFLEPTMQDFLAQSDIDLGSLHPMDTFLSDAENIYTSHGL
ncbi:hypothetical protein N7539_004369 [Penicillium diatomitis]|uniref:Xylanolytic transcriptional activator regulatory domain-containing protein n=1 Tax=Penicillium diatomitis TaxID=2819901 RepID=A0A9X0BYF0_9EURO|nr:uncharacterized protein N7539_004369 [Penicillium diatomitis]KAJ5489479.1 hypothetical protein N7539_004369 [Penicillium diatomitis]